MNSDRNFFCFLANQVRYEGKLSKMRFINLDFLINLLNMRFHFLYSFWKIFLDNFYYCLQYLNLDWHLKFQIIFSIQYLKDLMKILSKILIYLHLQLHGFALKILYKEGHIHLWILWHFLLHKKLMIYRKYYHDLPFYIMFLIVFQNFNFPLSIFINVLSNHNTFFRASLLIFLLL